MRHVSIAVLTLSLIPGALVADGGLPRVSQKRAGKAIAIFTVPTPPHVGVVDVSVLAQDERTGRPLLDASVEIVGHPVDHPERLRHGVPTSTSNKLMHAAGLAVDEPGPWRVNVSVDGESLSFEMLVEEAPPAWREVVGWLAWPFAAIVLYGVHLWLTRRSSTIRQLPPDGSGDS